MKPLEYARHWAEAGYYVFPVIPNGKIPLIKDGFKGASNKPEDVDDWIKAFPEANYGIACGASGLVVLDFDKKNGGLESLQKINEEVQELNTYPVATPGGGFHFYYHGVSPNRAGILPGFDVRGEGGYVVGPGSIIDGKLYESTHPDCYINRIPESLQKVLERPAAKPVKDITGERGSLNKRTLRFIAEGAIPGAWHQEFFQAAMDCKQNNYSYDEALELLSKATGHLDESHDIPQLQDVYTKRNPQYAPNIEDVAEDKPEPIYIKASDLLEDTVAYCNNKELTTGTPTGIDSLDELLGGGIRPGEVLGVLASAKVGKSAFTHKIIHVWLSRGMAVGYASRELRPASEVLPNLFSIEFKENVLKKGVEITRAGECLGKWSLYFAPGLGAFPVEEIEVWMRTLSSMGTKLFVFDHLIHFVNDEDYKMISMFARKIKALAQSLSVAVILVIQPTKLQPDQRINFNAIRGGAAVGQAIDSLIVLEREKDDRGRATNVTQVRLDIARHKLSRPGEIFLAYDSDTMDYEEVEPQEDPSPQGNPQGDGESEDTGPVFDRTRAGRAMETKRLDA